VPCDRCACGCGHSGGGGGGHHSGGRSSSHGSSRGGGGGAECIAGDSKRALSAGVNTPRKDGAALLQCTQHMCPIRVHWHVKLNYKDYWRAKIAITNFNYRMNYTQWTLVAQHPNLDNVTEVFSFQYKPLQPYGSINDTGMFYGLKLYNDLLMEAGPYGNVQSELLMRKDARTFTLSQGWAFPRKIYFNGDECKMPPPDSYPYLPNAAPAVAATSSQEMIAATAAFLLAMMLLVA
jgi:hypothetical protein